MVAFSLLSLQTFSSIATTLLLVSRVESFSMFNVESLSIFNTKPTAAAPVPSKIDRTKNPQWLDVLKYDGEPTFDVLQKTMDFANARTYDELKDLYHEDYVFRGPIIGPITSQEVQRTQQGFQIQDAYTDIETRPFGFTVDPDNPYRCYYMERWEGTNDGELKIGPLTIPPTNNEVQLPTHVMSLNWTPEGKVIYACLSSPLDRFEGTTKGAGAIFGLLVRGGLDNTNVSVGDAVLRLQQRFFHAIGGFGRNWSVEEEIPSWWKSKARGADPNDM